uniref:S1 motif domain-containing protein n=1 Tax=Panagrolaimus sp. JU765 TaxID=591449 RepID=A0AC34Q7N5_9BILA
MINYFVFRFSEENATIDLTFGQWYTTEIVEIRENGIFVRIKQGTKPLFIPNHELDIRKVQHASVLGLKEGQQIKIQYFGRDPVTGYHRLSRKITTGSEQKRADLLGKK